MLDLEKSEKLPPEKRYFNISVIWIFYFRLVIRLLYRWRVPHEAITLLSIIFGLIAAYFFYVGSFFLGAAAIHLKDIFDACDGAIARLTGKGHLIGRYLDSLGDFLTLTLTILAIALYAWNRGQSIYLLWGMVAIVSTFIQCSFFNYYQLSYLDIFGIKTLSSRKDEGSRNDLDAGSSSRFGRILLGILRVLYKIVYGWQDKLVATIDNSMAGNNRQLPPEIRFGNRKLLVLQSALCFGTQIFVIILFALLGRPQFSLIFISVIMNLYLLLVLYLRKRHYSLHRGNFSPVRQATEE